MARSLVVCGMCLVVMNWARVHRAAEAEGRPDSPRLSVIGRGRVLAKADVAEISLVLLCRGESAREAMKTGEASIRTLAESLKPRGVSETDIRSIHVSVESRFAHRAREGSPAAPDSGPPVVKQVGYQICHSVRITTRDLEQLGPILDELVHSGELQVHGVAFLFDNPETLLDQARRQAVADARRKAELFAGAANLEVDDLVSLHEVVAPPPTGRAIGLHEMARGVPATDGLLVPDAREQELSSTIEVVYKLHAPKG